MTERGPAGRWRFWALALLWLPAGVVVAASLRFAAVPGETPDPAIWLPMLLMSAQSLIVVAPCGLPLALGCRKLWRLGRRRSAWVAGGTLGAVTAAASLVAGLLGPLAIAAYAVVLSLPVWAAWWWLARRG